MTNQWENLVDCSLSFLPCTNFPPKYMLSQGESQFEKAITYLLQEVHYDSQLSDVKLDRVEINLELKIVFPSSRNLVICHVICTYVLCLRLDS